jgi:hypothetical protein
MITQLNIITRIPCCRTLSRAIFQHKFHRLEIFIIHAMSALCLLERTKGKQLPAANRAELLLIDAQASHG